MSTKRLFFSLWPDDRQREQLRDAISPIAGEIEGRAVSRASWHVTLVFIGEFPEQRIPALMASASQIQVEPFRLSFDRAEFWPRPKIAVLGARIVPPELQALVDSLHDLMREHGVDTREMDYRPHITIVRRARSFEPRRLAQPLLTQWSGFELIESRLNAGGARYRPLKQ
jgi:2'-5' RNA ligase